MRLAITFAVLAFAGTANAETSKELAEKSRLAWSALSCSALASTAEKPQEAERLFRLGYEAAKTFMNAAFAKKIDKADIESTMPMVMGFSMYGPSVDFMIGRVWEKAVEDAHKKVHFDDAGAFRPNEVWKDYAASEFRDRNCQLIH